MKFIYKFEAMSTPCELVVFDKNKVKSDLVAQEILKETKRLEKKYSYYNQDSFLSKINKKEEKEIDLETKSLFQRAIFFYRTTSGVFDVTVATIKDLYWQGLKLDEFLTQKEKLSPFIGCEHFEIKKNKIIFDNKYTKIDLGGFVKEYAVDNAVKILQKKKIASAIVNFGGDIFALGKKPDGTKIKIGIKDPQNRADFADFTEIEDEALTTSASYERNYKIDGKIFSHIISKNIDSNKPLSVSVVSKNCVESGVYSTSIMADSNVTTKNKTIIIYPKEKS